MVTKNGFRFGVGVFAVCFTMLLAGHLSAALSEKAGDPVTEAAFTGTNALTPDRN